MASALKSNASLGVFAPALKTRLNYCEQINLTSTSGSVGTYLFRPNDLYDPNITATGHQWMFRDQLYALYQYARVTYFSIEVKGIISGNTTGGIVYLGPAVSGSADTDLILAAERSNGKYQICSGSNGRVSLKYKNSVDAFFGQKKGHVMLSDNFEQTAGSALNAAYQCVCQILFQDMNASTSAFSGVVKLVCWARFEQKIQVAAS